MTHNQINYWTLQESKRSNKAKEVETNRHNVATETQSSRELAETERSNRARESENYRHNFATETESARHNVSTERQTANDLLEKSRSNRAQEALKHEYNLVKASDVAEKNRANLAKEVIDRSNATANLIGAQSNVDYRTGLLGLGAVDSRTRQLAQQETERSNRAMEKLKETEVGAKFGSDILSTLGGLGQTILRR